MDVNPAPRGVRRPMAATGLFLLGAVLFSAAYCQAPLYYSNQNQYFVHGIADVCRADGDQGFLHDDWLAKTADPTPLFSSLVAITAMYAHPWLFHVYHAILLGIYAAALLGVFAFVVGPEIASRRWPIFLALLVAIHSGIARWASYQILGGDYPWYLQAGVAGQYVLGSMLQPSVFGVLLVAAIALFVHRMPYAAVACIAAGATVHSTYLLPGALITAGFLTAQLRAGETGAALRTAALALLLVLPVAAFVALTFAPLSAAMFAEAQSILVNLRIPHHARPELWLDPIAAAQIAWLVVATALVWRTTLFPVMAVPLGLGSVLTAIQAATGSDMMALLFPWRVSSILIPIATTIILSRLVALRALPFDGNRVIATIIVICLAAAGVWIGVARQAFRGADEEAELIEFVRKTRAESQVYLLPVRIPNLAAATYGSFSSDFKPLAAKRDDARVIPVDLQRFRLSARVPIFVDFKAIPYKDKEVVEWLHRMQLAEGWHKALREGRTDDVLGEISLRGVTHIVLPAGRDYSDPGLRRVHEDPRYQVYRLGG